MGWRCAACPGISPATPRDCEYGLSPQPPIGVTTPSVETRGPRQHRSLCLGQSSLALLHAHPEVDVPGRVKDGRALPKEGPLPKEGRARWRLRLVGPSRCHSATSSPVRSGL